MVVAGVEISLDFRIIRIVSVSNQKYFYPPKVQRTETGEYFEVLRESLYRNRRFRFVFIVEYR